MHTINLHIEQDLLGQAIQHFKQFLAEHQTKGNMTYVDDIGDTIEIINGVEYVVPTKADLKAMNTPREKHNFTSLDALKKELCIN
jgi:hypothetical protein